MLLNFQRNSHKGNLSKLINSWGKEYSLKNTRIEFMLEQQGQSYLYDHSNMHEFISQVNILDQMLKDKKIWSLPILFYYIVDNQSFAFQFILFDGSIKGFDEEQTKQCFVSNSNYQYKSSVFLLNKWNYKKHEVD